MTGNGDPPDTDIVQASSVFHDVGLVLLLPDFGSYAVKRNIRCRIDVRLLVANCIEIRIFGRSLTLGRYVLHCLYELRAH